jgi:hypothetical protein
MLFYVVNRLASNADSQFLFVTPKCYFIVYVCDEILTSIQVV